MKNFIQAAIATVLVVASVGTAMAQSTNYYAPGRGLIGYSQTHGNTTNYFVPGRGLIGSSIHN